METRMDNASLVLEGGGLRCTFTNGILDTFLQESLAFQHTVGVSAGACAAASYISRQKGRNWRVNVELASDPQFMGLRHLILKGSYFNPKFTFQEIPDRLAPFDYTAYFNNPAEADYIATARSTGQSVVFGKDEQKRLGINEVLLASSSIPLLAPAVKLDHDYYFDGGVADSIPVEYALTKRNKAVVILTQPRGYRKGPQGKSRMLRWSLRHYPEFLSTVLQRNERYNDTLALCERLEREGRIFVFAPHPDYLTSRIEPSQEKRGQSYRHGEQTAQMALPKLREFLA